MGLAEKAQNYISIWHLIYFVRIHIIASQTLEAYPLAELSKKKMQSLDRNFNFKMPLLQFFWRLGETLTTVDRLLYVLKHLC